MISLELSGSNTNEAAFFLQLNYKDKFGNFSVENPITESEELCDYLNRTIPDVYKRRLDDYFDMIAEYYDPNAGVMMEWVP